MTGATSAVMIGATVGGSLLSGLGQVQAGRAANNSAKFQASQLEQQAGQERASSQHAAEEERRRSDIAISNATAAAAASGGGATDPTVLNIQGGLAEEGEYNALSALFQGGERARGLNLQAASVRSQGKQAKSAGLVGGASTILSGAGGSLLSKYSPTATGSSDLPWQAAGNVNPQGGYYG